MTETDGCDCGKSAEDRCPRMVAMEVPETRPRTVVVETPYAGDVASNVRYLRACLRDSLLRGEAPFASHAIYTQPGVLDDLVPEERSRGIEAGFAWRRASDATVVYHDLGISAGMELGVQHAKAAGQVVEYRTLAGWSTCA